MRHVWKKIGAAAAIALIVMGLIAWLLLERVFVVRNVVIEGNVSASNEEIIRQAQLNFGGSILDVDEAQVRSSLEGSGKYALDGLSVRYPQTVALSVRERTRDGMVQVGGRILVVDADGYVVEVVDNVPENSGLYVRGLDCTSYNLGRRVTAPEAQLSVMKAVLTAVRAQNAGTYLSEVNVADPLKLWMVSRTGLRVELGNAEKMDDKILWACSAIADLEARGETRGTLDVTSGAMADFRAQH